MVLDKEINQIYFYESFRNFGMDLIGLFIPIYLLSQGFGFEYAIGFLLVEQLTGILFSVPVSVLIARIGFKHSILGSYGLILPAILLIRSNMVAPTIITLSAVLYGTGKAIHKISLSSEFAVDSHKDKRDSESSKMLGLPNISRFLAPIAGGYILNKFGFNLLTSISILFFIVAAAVLMKSKDHRDPLRYSMKSMIKENYSKTFPVFFARGILNVTAITGFALFTYLFIGSEIDAGYVAAVDNLGLLATAAISGKLSKKFGRTPLILFGLIGSAIIHFSRITASTPSQALLISGIGGIVFMFYEIPLFSNYADLAENEDILEFYTAKRVLFKLGQLVTTTLIIGIGILYGLKQGFQASFILAGLTSLTITLWTKQDWI